MTHTTVNSSIINVGIAGMDGHGPVFAEAIMRDMLIPGMRVSAALPIASSMVSKSTLRENCERIQALGVAIVDSPGALLEAAEGILILHDDGAQHLPLVESLAQEGKPLFIDKPLEVSAARARRIREICSVRNTPFFTASALRFCDEVQHICFNTENRICAASTYAPLIEHPSMPGWIYYAVHAVEMLYALLGPGCQKVRCTRDAQRAVATGTWQDGRQGIANAIVPGPHEYGFTVQYNQGETAMQIAKNRIYTGLLERIRTFVCTGNAPVTADESVEVVAFLEAANRSMVVDGREEQLMQS